MKLAYALPQLDKLSADSIRNLISRMAGIGYAGVEFLINDPSRIDGKNLKRMLTETGLRLSGLRTGSVYVDGGLSFSDPDREIRRLAVERIKEIISFASEYETGLLMGLVQGRGKTGENSSVLKGRVLDCIAECLETARRFRVPLCLEPLNRFEISFNLTTEEVLEFLEPLNGKSDFPVRLLLDTFHIALEEDSAAAALCRGSGGMIGHIHYSDSNRGIPGTGTFDFLEFTKVLVTIEYDGWITMELDDKPDIFTAAEVSRHYVRALLEVVETGNRIKKEREAEK